MRSSSSHPRIAALVAVGLVAALCLLSPTTALALSPAIALLLAVVAGLFSGEQAMRLVRRALRSRRPAAVTAAAPARPRREQHCRGGLLVAASLASRPPPALA